MDGQDARKLRGRRSLSSGHLIVVTEPGSLTAPLLLFESCVYREPSEAGLEDLNHSALFIRKPYSLDELQKAIRLLVKWVEKSGPLGKAESG